ncbi:hypothetical protein [Planobispora takensis]|uniref:VWA domain-containing protein n=1 Tax=Planobispora takensis TaxID=1367882 RepID=A0A8J3SYL4_9ACTN|nr:hypothetical protein [Planobispora takensis]GII03059.1 hypothetical protein Pta02_50670 [Planobispora takensis]
MNDVIACEDVLLFVNAAITSTGQREFRSTAGEQRLSLDFLHRYIMGNYREVYSAALALEINDHNAALIARNLLADGATEREGRLIARRLRTMAPQRVYALFTELRRAGVNNRRTRAVIGEWLGERPDLAFDAVKYRRALKEAVRHAHLRLPGELGDFLFAPRRRARLDAPLLDAWRRAHHETRAVYELPYTVAEGFAARHRIPRERFLAAIAPRMTRLERLRSGSAPDLAAMPLVRLASYALALPHEERVSRRAELHAALRASAVRAAGGRAGSWGRVTAVLDDSFSSYGSGHKRRRPLAVALGCHYLLRELAGQYRAMWLSHRGDPLLVRPAGATPLGERLLDALETRPDLLVVVSDGWDNAPPGLAAEVLRVWRERIDPSAGVVHLNPVYDAGGFDVRRLSPETPTAGIRDAESLPALVELARFATGRAGYASLLGYLGERTAER